MSWTTTVLLFVTGFIQEARSGTCILVLHEMESPEAGFVESATLLKQTETENIKRMKILDLLFCSKQEKIYSCDVNKATRQELKTFIKSYLKSIKIEKNY